MENEILLPSEEEKNKFIEYIVNGVSFPQSALYDAIVKDTISWYESKLKEKNKLTANDQTRKPMPGED